MNPRRLHRPGRRARIETGLAESLQPAAQVRAGQSQRQKIRETRDRAAGESRQKCDLATFLISQRPRNKSRHQRDNRKCPDYESDRLIASAQIVANVKRHAGKHRPDAQEREKSGRNERPEFGTQSLCPKLQFLHTRGRRVHPSILRLMDSWFRRHTGFQTEN